MTPQELKNSILQMAIQGKLVEQRPEEGTAEELYQQIQAEKKRLIAEKKIKKDKPLPEISENEKTFEIPESWKWVRLDELVCKNIKRGKSPKYAVTSNTLVFAQKCNTKIGKIDMSLAQFLDETTLSKYPESEFMLNNDIVVNSTGNGTLGRIGFFNNSDNPSGMTIVPDSHVTVVRPSRHINAKYVLYCLKCAQPNLERMCSGSTNQTELKPDVVRSLLIALPPLAEQKRIIAKIEELLPLIDRYEAAWSRLEAFNKRFPEEMQKSVLQQAIQGKLVEQRPEEGTGEELYQQIQAEKQRLIKEKKIKMDKPLPEITDEEKPFDIPDSWKWIRLGELAVVQSSKRVFEKDYVEYGVPFFRSKEIGDLNRGDEIHTRLFISETHYEQLKQDYGVPKRGDILITSVGTIGNTWICDGRPFYYKDGNITQIVSNPYFNSRYIQLYLASPFFFAQALGTVSGTAYNALTIIKLKNIIVPLPPLAEQKRIVAKIEELLPLCQKLKQRKCI